MSHRHAARCLLGRMPPPRQTPQVPRLPRRPRPRTLPPPAAILKPPPLRHSERPLRGDGPRPPLPRAGGVPLSRLTALRLPLHAQPRRERRARLAEDYKKRHNYATSLTFRGEYRALRTAPQAPVGGQLAYRYTTAVFGLRQSLLTLNCRKLCGEARGKSQNPMSPRRPLFPRCSRLVSVKEALFTYCIV
jgi:hypothetical protein